MIALFTEVSGEPGPGHVGTSLHQSRRFPTHRGQADPNVRGRVYSKEPTLGDWPCFLARSNRDETEASVPDASYDRGQRRNRCRSVAAPVVEDHDRAWPNGFEHALHDLPGGDTGMPVGWID